MNRTKPNYQHIKKFYNYGKNEFIQFILSGR